eukprot:gene7471-6992_t
MPPRARSVDFVTQRRLRDGWPHSARTGQDKVPYGMINPEFASSKPDEFAGEAVQQLAAGLGSFVDVLVAMEPPLLSYYGSRGVDPVTDLPTLRRHVGHTQQTLQTLMSDTFTPAGSGSNLSEEWATVYRLMGPRVLRLAELVSGLLPS